MAHSDIFLNILGIAIIVTVLVIVIMGMAELVKLFAGKSGQHNTDLALGKRKLQTMK